MWTEPAAIAVTCALLQVSLPPLLSYHRISRSACLDVYHAITLLYSAYAAGWLARRWPCATVAGGDTSGLLVWNTALRLLWDVPTCVVNVRLRTRGYLGARSLSLVASAAMLLLLPDAYGCYIPFFFGWCEIPCVLHSASCLFEKEAVVDEYDSEEEEEEEKEKDVKVWEACAATAFMVRRVAYVLVVVVMMVNVAGEACTMQGDAIALFLPVTLCLIVCVNG